MNSVVLLPMPRKIEARNGTFAGSAQRHVIQISGESPSKLLPAARVIQTAAQGAWSIAAGTCDASDIAVSVSIARFDGSQSQYTIDIQAEQIAIRASDPAMAYYAAQTVRQLFRQYPANLPCLHIEDWPDFPVRGVMLDISRDKVPTMATLYRLVDLLALMKINQLQLYTEHTFAYRDIRRCGRRRRR